MAKRSPLSTGTVKSVRFDFALDDDDFEDTPGDLYPMSDPEFLPRRRNARSEHCCFYGICTSFTGPF